LYLEILFSWAAFTLSRTNEYANAVKRFIGFEIDPGYFAEARSRLGIAAEI
jgi:hypothetical protein